MRYYHASWLAAVGWPPERARSMERYCARFQPCARVHAAAGALNEPRQSWQFASSSSNTLRSRWYWLRPANTWLIIKNFYVINMFFYAVQVRVLKPLKSSFLFGFLRLN